MCAARRNTADGETVGRAFNGRAVLLFVALVGAFSLVSELLIRWPGALGALIGSAVMAVKAPTAFVTGGRTYGRQVSIGVLILIAGLWIGGVVAVMAGEIGVFSIGRLL